jgi:hypothetical protein
LWDPKYHVIKPFKIPNAWRIDRSYDYGSSAPAAYLLFAESDGEEYLDQRTKKVIWFPAGSLIICGEIYFADKNRKGLRMTAAQQASRIYRYEIERGLNGRVEAGPADNAIFSAEPGRESISQLMHNEGVDFTKSDKSPGSRIMGVSLMRQMLINALNVPKEGPGIYVMDTCTHTIRTIPSLDRDEDKPDDINSEGEDHIWDVIRYRLLKKRTQARETKVVGW